MFDVPPKFSSFPKVEIGTIALAEYQWMNNSNSPAKYPMKYQCTPEK